MGKVLWKTAVLFGAILCLSLFHDGAAAEIPVPDKGFTLVLRAPTSERPRLVKISHVDGERKEEVLPGFKVSLPKDTPIFFKVDQVNTVLYTVKISAEEEKSMTQTVPGLLRKLSVEYEGPDWVRELKADFLEKLSLSAEGEGEAEKLFKAAEQETEQAFEDLVSKAEAVVKLNQELENFLYRSETSQFYADGAAAGFRQIKTSAIAAAKAKLQLPQGTPQEIRHTAAEALAAVHNAYKEFGEKPPAHLPKDLSDSSNKIVEPFLKAAKTLGEIESATWDKEDTQERLLKNKVTYTCAIAPKVEGTKQLASFKREVTVESIVSGWTVKFTEGAFVSGLRDKSYLMKEIEMKEIEMNGSTSPDAMGNANAEIKREIVPGGIEDQVTTSPGVLVHLAHTRLKWLGLSPGLSGGVGIDGAKNLQVSLGLSVLFNTHDEQAFALTFGWLTGRVKDLDGYVGGDFFKGAGPLPTKLVTKISWFGAITFNFDSLFGSGQTGTPN